MGKIHRIPVLGTAFAFKGRKLVVAQDRHGSATHSKFLNGQGSFDSELMAKVIYKPDYLFHGQRLTWDEAYGPNAILKPELRGEATIIEGTGRERAPHEYLGNRKNKLTFGGQLYNLGLKLWYKALYRNKTLFSLGSGLTTNVAAQAIMNEWNLAAPSAAAINTIKLANYHTTGTGSTAAAATDIMLTTADAVSSQAGTQSNVSVGNTQKYQTVATMSGYGTEAVTEWGLSTGATFSTTTGTPLTAAAVGSATVTGTPLTASSTTVQGQQQHILVDTTASPNVYALVLSNTTSVATILAWYRKDTGAAGSTPGNTDAIAWYQILLDHKVFSAINTVSGDTIQFTYQLTIASGN